MTASFTRLWIRGKVSCSDCDNLGNTKLKTNLNFNIVVDTQTTLLQCKTQPGKTDCSTQ